jgi:hypothetical protein
MDTCFVKIDAADAVRRQPMHVIQRPKRESGSVTGVGHTAKVIVGHGHTVGQAKLPGPIPAGTVWRLNFALGTVLVIFALHFYQKVHEDCQFLHCGNE